MTVISQLFDWVSETLDSAINLGVAHVVALFFMVVAFGISWIALGEWWFGSYDQRVMALFRHEHLPWIPDVWESGSTGNWLMIWFAVVVVVVLIGAVFGMTATWEADPDQHYTSVVMFKAGCLVHYLVNGTTSMAVGMVKDPAAAAASFLIGAWNFLKPGATILGTPYFVAINTAFGTFILSICGLVTFSWIFGIVPAFYRGAFTDEATLGTFPILGLVVVTPFVVPALAGILLGVLNCFWMGYAMMVWVLSFLPSRWKARRAFRLRARDLVDYIDEVAGDAFPVDDNFQPIRTSPLAPPNQIPRKVSLQQEVTQWK